MRASWGYLLEPKFLLLALSAAFIASAQSPKYQVLDPRGAWPAVDRVPLAARVSNLNGKRIYVIKSWAANSGFDQTILDLAKALEAPGATATITDRNVGYSQDDPKLWAEMKARQAAGFIYVAAASSSTTSYAFKWSAHLEHDGFDHHAGQVVDGDGAGELVAGLERRDRPGEPGDEQDDEEAAHPDVPRLGHGPGKPDPPFAEAPDGV